MEEIAASSSRWRATLAFSFSAARFSAGAGFSVAFGGISFSVDVGLVISDWAGLVNGTFKDFKDLGVARTGSACRVSPAFEGASGRAVEEWFSNDSVDNLFIMPSFIAGGVGHLQGNQKND